MSKENVVTAPDNSQETKPSIPLKSSFPRVQLGDSGTRGIRGLITEEYNPQLRGIQGIKVFDEMRKSDGTVKAAVSATTLPIRRAKWFVNPVSEDKTDLEIANFVEHALFDWHDLTWDDFIRQALLCVPFGVMVFEKVYGTIEHEGKTYVTVKKLAPRMPSSIQQWELPDNTFGIQQIRQDGQTVNIPGDKLLIFINDREGDNWWGTSMIRAAYKHWYYKNNFYKIDAMAFERQGMGVPYIKMPMGYTENDQQRAENALRNIRANEEAFLTLPDGYEAGFMSMGAGSTRDPEKSIMHHNREISKSVLAQFLELGASSGSGSRAVSQDHSDLFLKAIETVAGTIQSEINKKLIPELVDLNFNDVTIYPKIDYSGITRTDVAAISEAYSKLVTAGAIIPTEDDEQYLRASIGLPPRSKSNDVDTTKSELDMLDGIDNDDVDEDDDMIVDDGAEDVNDKKKQQKKDDKVADKEIKKAHSHVKLKRIYDDGNGFQSWRKLTFAEQKVSWKNIQDKMDKLEAEFSAEAKEALTKAKDKFMIKLHQALVDEDTKAIADLELAFVNEYKSIVKTSMVNAYEYGKNNVSAEMKIQSPPNTAKTIANIDLIADTTAYKTASDIEAKAKISVANATNKKLSPLQAAALVEATMEEVIEKSVANAAGLIIGQSVNMGRNDVFERNHGMIKSLQRSELLDEKTCSFCLSMDGLVIDPKDKWAKTDIFHSHCRGIWVEIFNDEQNSPDITGIPDEIGDYYGGEPNSLIQPPRPILQEGSPAADEVERRKKEKKKKK